ncbi:restriction endonuclease subunit S [Flavobacterium sp.]|uniref:restriction endonuclease subunit S n=1 Tax=Flavobacterium sp. TaxID=239 RepID=UPI0026240763|nr:restriction endonuclease subunit S [Flavobacterium sp.]
MGLETNKVTYKKSWTLVKLNEFCTRISDGVHFKPEYINEGIPFISVKDVYNDKVHFDNCKYISLEAHKELIKRCFPEKDDILITKSGTIGRMALVPEKPEFSLFVSVALIKNIKERIDSKFLKFCLENFLNHINIAQDIKGGLLKNFHLEDIRQTLIPQLPISEQLNIVLKLEELFSELDKGIEDLKTAQLQLKTYRQSVLKWAFEGKLTNENVKDGALPKEWKIVDLKEVCEIKRGKSKHRPRNAPELYGGNYPFIQTGDIRNANGGYIKRYSQTYSEIGLAQSKLWPKGTLCITIAANIGETAILDFDACFPDSVVGLLSKSDVLLNKYLNYFFISFKQKLEELAPATAQKNINVDILEKVNIPLAPFTEQLKIIQEIESRLSVADKMEESIAQSMQQAEALRQSILKKAFSGELV